jgi:peptidyl-prolyl cis-trans isomerase D
MDALEGDLIVQTLQQGILGTGFSTREEIAQAVAVASETRDFQYFVVPAELYLETVEIDEEQVALFYEENREQFRLPEQVSVNYLLVDRERISQNIEVSEAQIQEAYRLESAASLPQREAAHILIAPREDGSDAAVVAEVQQKLEAGSDFSELAAEYSDDLGSANFGGELGYTDGSLFPEAFESALAALEVGEVSAPVTTDSGTHFIKLAGFDAGSATPLEEMRGVLESNIREAMADQSYQILLDQVRDSAFATDDLQQLLDDLRDDHGLVIEQSGYFSREAGEGIAANDLFRSLAFSPLVLEERLNSELIELTDTTAAVVHLRDRQPARDATLSEVSAEITRVLALQQAAAMTKERGEELLQRASGEESLEQIAQSEGLDWQVVIGSPRDFADPAKINAFSVNESEPLQGFSTSSGDYMILKLDEISPGSLSGLQPEEQQAVMRELSFVEGNLALNSYLQLMRSSRDIEIR